MKLVVGGGSFNRKTGIRCGSSGGVHQSRVVVPHRGEIEKLRRKKRTQKLQQAIADQCGIVRLREKSLDWLTVVWGTINDANETEKGDE